MELYMEKDVVSMNNSGGTIPTNLILASSVQNLVLRMLNLQISVEDVERNQHNVLYD